MTHLPRHAFRSTQPPGPSFQPGFCIACGILPLYTLPSLPPCERDPAPYYRQIQTGKEPANEP